MEGVVAGGAGAPGVVAAADARPAAASASARMPAVANGGDATTGGADADAGVGASAAAETQQDGRDQKTNTSTTAGPSVSAKPHTATHGHAQAHTGTHKHTQPHPATTYPRGASVTRPLTDARRGWLVQGSSCPPQLPIPPLRVQGYCRVQGWTLVLARAEQGACIQGASDHRPRWWHGCRGRSYRQQPAGRGPVDRAGEVRGACGRRG